MVVSNMAFLDNAPGLPPSF